MDRQVREFQNAVDSKVQKPGPCATSLLAVPLHLVNSILQLLLVLRFVSSFFVHVRSSAHGHTADEILGKPALGKPARTRIKRSEDTQVWLSLDLGKGGCLLLTEISDAKPNSLNSSSHIQQVTSDVLIPLIAALRHMPLLQKLHLKLRLIERAVGFSCGNGGLGSEARVVFLCKKRED